MKLFVFKCIIAFSFGLIYWLFMRKKKNVDLLLVIALDFVALTLFLKKTAYLINISTYQLLLMRVDTVVKLLGISLIIILISNVLLIIVQCIYGDRRYLVGKILPAVSLKCLTYSVSVAFLILSIVDNYMTLYEYWRIEDTNRKSESSTYRIYSYGTGDYPLIWNSSTDILLNGKGDNKVILVLGDSFVWGDGCINSNDLWWQQLSRKLRENGYENCKVVAVGTNGASTQHELNWITSTSMIQDINPDLIIIGYVTNDPVIEDENGEMLPKQFTGTVDYAWDFKFMNEMFPNAWDIIGGKINAKKETVVEYTDETGYPYGQWEDEIIKPDRLAVYNEVAVKPLGEAVNELGIPTIVITNPNTPNKAFAEKYEKVLPLFDAAGIKTYDLLENFVSDFGGASEEKMRINPVNGHPGPLANGYYADFAYEVLTNGYSEYLGAKNAESNLNEIWINDWWPHSVMAYYDGSTIQFNYPSEEDETKFTYMPMKESCIQISFRHPIDISKLELRSNDVNFKSAKIWVTSIDSSTGYDSLDVKKLKKQSQNAWTCEYEKVTSLYIHTDIENGTGGAMELVVTE